MIFVLYGDEVFLKNKKVKDIKDKYQINLPEINEVTLSFIDDSFETIIKECETVPFFSDYRFVLFKNPYFLSSKSIKKALKEDEIQLLFSKMEETNDDSIYIFLLESKLDERKKLVKNLRKNATFIECKQLPLPKLKAAIRNAFSSRNTSIEEDALELLLQRVPQFLLPMEREVEKLSLAGNKITYEMVDQLVNKPMEENVFELSNAILKRDQSKAIEIYKDLMLKNEEPIKLIVMIANALRLLYQVSLLDRKGYNDQEIADYIGINKFRLRYIRLDKESYQLDDLLYFIDQLAILDSAIKQGKIDKKLGFELFLMKL